MAPHDLQLDISPVPAYTNGHTVKIPNDAKVEINGGEPRATLLSLAEEIQQHAQTISEYHTTNRLLQPSLDLNGPDDYSKALPDAIQLARAKLRAATADMDALAAGPKENIMGMVWGYHNVSSLHYVTHFRIAEAVPLIGSIPYEEIASITNTSPGRVKRVLRYLALHHVFAEPQPGRFAHTPASRQLITSDHVRSWVGVRTQETGPAAFALVAATDRWGADPQEVNCTPYSHVHSDGKFSRFESLALPENKHRQERFANLMKALQDTEPYDLKHTVDGYSWQQLGEGALVVDVGGSTASTAQAIARAAPNLRIVVQDLPRVVAQGRELLPPDLAGRIDFMEYDFLTKPQPIKDASAYIFRHIFHDWPDKYAAVALRHTSCFMQPGQKLIIIDVIMPPPRSTVSTFERTLRRSDMEMMIQFNSLEREVADWTNLMKQADARLQIKSIYQPVGSANSVIEMEVMA